MLRRGIDPEKLYRATLICQDGLCCCNMALISFRLFRKNLGILRDFFGQMVYRPPPPWQKFPVRLWLSVPENRIETLCLKRTSSCQPLEAEVETLCFKHILRKPARKHILLP